MKKGMIGVGGAVLCLILSATSGIAREMPKAFTLKLGGAAAHKVIYNNHFSPVLRIALRYMGPAAAALAASL